MDKKGFLYGLLCYVSWGFVPIYWSQLKALPKYELLAHRLPWTFLALLILVLCSKKFFLVKETLKDKRIYFSSFFLVINWCVYVWSVASGYIVETSLGYFINPLVSIFLGVVVLKEKLGRVKVICLILAIIGISFMFYQGVDNLWISLVLAFSFGIYGYLRKRMGVDPNVGLLIESGLFTPIALVVLFYYGFSGQLYFHKLESSSLFLLMFCGAVTIIPLWSFGHAVRRLDLSTIGFMQYIAPSIQLLIGVFMYNENFSSNHFLGFSCIWLALILLSLSNLKRINVGRKKLEPITKL